MLCAWFFLISDLKLRKVCWGNFLIARKILKIFHKRSLHFSGELLLFLSNFSTENIDITRESILWEILGMIEKLLMYSRRLFPDPQNKLLEGKFLGKNWVLQRKPLTIRKAYWTFFYFNFPPMTIFTKLFPMWKTSD